MASDSMRTTSRGGGKGGGGGGALDSGGALGSAKQISRCVRYGDGEMQRTAAKSCTRVCSCCSYVGHMYVSEYMFIYDSDEWAIATLGWQK